MNQAPKKQIKSIFIHIYSEWITFTFSTQESGQSLN